MLRSRRRRKAARTTPTCPVLWEQPSGRTQGSPLRENGARPPLLSARNPFDNDSDGDPDGDGDFEGTPALRARNAFGCGYAALWHLSRPWCLAFFSDMAQGRVPRGSVRQEPLVSLSNRPPASARGIRRLRDGVSWGVQPGGRTAGKRRVLCPRPGESFGKRHVCKLLERRRAFGALSSRGWVFWWVRARPNGAKARCRR